MCALFTRNPVVDGETSFSINYLDENVFIFFSKN
jgi:hypothetical protein